VILYYVHADHLNTPRLVTDTSNNIRWRWDSDPFGATQPNENPASLGNFTYNLRFPGQQYDAVVGLHYNYFRDYDPALGGYTQSDPIGLRGGINTYAYVRRNPLSRIDPLGRAKPRSRPRNPGAPYIPGPADIFIPNTPANDAWVNSASQAIDALHNPPSSAGIADSGIKVRPKPDEKERENNCPPGIDCYEWKSRVMMYYDNVITLELIVGARNNLNRANYRLIAKEYNAACGLVAGRVPDEIESSIFENN
jgi:RHS repeat-associated protein